MYTHVAAVLRGVVSVLHLHFLNGIHAGRNVRHSDEIIHDGDAVERQAVGDFALAGTNEIFPGRDACRACFGSEDDIRGRSREFQRISAIQRQVHDRLVVDSLSNGGVISGNGRSSNVYSYCL